MAVKLTARKGLTGNAAGYEGANGLIKVLRLIERYKHNNEHFYIIIFSNEDYDLLLSGVPFLDLIKAKKLEANLASSFEQFLKTNRHEAEEQIKEIISDFNENF